MSFYLSDKLLRDWADKTLHKYLDPREYPAIHAALRSPKRSTRMTRVEIGVMRLLLCDYRPERSEREQRAYAQSNAIRKGEIGDTLGCPAGTVGRASKRLNTLVKQGARVGTHARKHGIILFHNGGICINATFWDAQRAREFSEKSGSSSLDTHTSNIALADEKQSDGNIKEEQMRKFALLSPTEQARLLEAVSGVSA